MKVAVVSDDERTISPHFGRALHYVVYEVANGSVQAKEVRAKTGHGPGGHEHHHSDEGGPEMEDTHSNMLSNIRDCEVVIARGMGRPMYEAISRAGLKAYITRVASPDDAVKALIAGSLDNNTELLH